MDPFICCLLGICCPPLMRRRRVAAYITTFGIAQEASEKLADDLIAKADSFMGTTIGGMMKQVVLASMAHSDDDKE